MFHTSAYPRRGSSLSCIVQYLDENSITKYGKIFEFRVIDTVLYAHVYCFKIDSRQSFAKYYDTSNLNNKSKTILGYLKYLFHIVKLTDQIECVPVNNFVTRCLLFPFHKDHNVKVIVPLIDVFEHD